jgi:hypothetical protein
MSNQLKAIYRPVVTDEQVQSQDTLIYNLKDGFTWVRLAAGNSEWHCFARSAPAAERAAIESGHAPQAIAYIG